MSKQVRRKLSSLECDCISLTGKHTDNGVEGRFFKMSKNSKFGIKVYEDFNAAEKAWSMQKKAAKKGLGPKVGKLLFIKYKENKKSNAVTCFGYETEVAQPLRRGFRNPIWNQQSRRLEIELCKIGCGGDFRPRNCGVINNKLVCVDFGNCSHLASCYS